MRRNHLFLLFLLSHLQYTKHFTDDFYMSSYCIYPLNIKQIAIIGLMLSATAWSCRCGTNELSGSGFQSHSIGSVMLVSISLSLQK